MKRSSAGFFAKKRLPPFCDGGRRFSFSRKSGSESVVFRFDLEVGFRVLAGRAHFRSFFADVDVSAVQTDPFLRSDAGENFTFSDVFDELAVTLFMML